MRTYFFRTFTSNHMHTNTMTHKARFDTRLPLEQKQRLERAAQLGGYRSLSDFVLTVAEQKATEILEKAQQIELSQQDAAVFCAAILSDAAPNDYLKESIEQSAHYFQWKRK
jgi:uncharacterized protein (DUF1778 family)